MRDWLRVAAGVRPEHSYIGVDDRTVTFIEADRTADAIAGALPDLTTPSARIGLWAESRPDTVTAMFGIWRSGACAVLLNPRLTPSELRPLLDRAGVELILGRGVPDLGLPTVDPSALDGPSLGHADLDPSSDAWLVATSGSSGSPKWVRLTFGNLEASAAASASLLDHRPGDVWLANLPVSHVGGAMIAIRTARQGASMLLEQSFDPAVAAKCLETGRATLYSFVATTLEATLDRLETEVSPGVKAALVGGGPVPAPLHRRAVDAGIPVLRSYGMTEACSQVATEKVPDAGVTPVDGVELRVVDGQVEVRGSMVSPGYLDGPSGAPNEWFRTGDLGDIDPIGRLTITGRADLVIITGGENVSPEEVEAAILTHDGVAGAVVAGVPDPRWGTAVAAIYEGTAAPGELERHLRYRLAGYKIPKVWLHVDEIPSKGIGKPDRAAVAGLIGGVSRDPDAADPA